ncbi:MAG: AbrB/MazE/SpoVT family DNA-binding domain-containing protein [Spirochaetia bacterium]
MEAKIQKWGNSLGVRIPGFIAKKLSLKHGSPVEIGVEMDKIVIRSKEKYDLDAMIGEISDNNIHSEVDFGAEEGKEIW